MSATARLKGELSLDDSAFHSALRKATEGCGKFAKDAEKQLKTIGFAGITAGAAAAGAAFVGLGAAIKTGLDVGGKFDDLSKRIGDLPGKIAILSTAFETAGLNSDDVAGAIGKMQKAMVGGSGAFGKLGLDAAKLQSMAPTDALIQVGNAIASIQNPAEQTAAAMELFGKSGAQLKQIFGDDGAMALAVKALGSMPEILNRSAGNIGGIGDKVDLLATKWQGFSAGITEGLAPALGPLLDKIMSVDTAAFGVGLGKDIAGAFNGQPVNSAMVDVSSRFLKLMIAAGVSFGDALGGILTKTFEKPIADFQGSIQAAAKDPLGLLAEGVNKLPAMRGVTAATGYKIPTNFNKLAASEAADNLSNGVRTGLGEGLTADDRIKQAVDSFAEQAKQIVPNTYAAAAGAMANGSPNAVASSGLFTATGAPGGTRMTGMPGVDGALFGAGLTGGTPSPSAPTASGPNPILEAIARSKAAMNPLLSQNLAGMMRSVPVKPDPYNSQYFDKYAPNHVDDGRQLNLTPQSGALRSNVADSNPLSLEPESALRKPSRQVAWARRKAESEEDFAKRVDNAKSGNGGQTQGDPNAKMILDEIKKWSSAGKT